MKEIQVYRAIHIVIKHFWGKAIKCELCKGKNKSKRYEWSNKNHKYTLNRKEWQQLCATCHRRYDRKKFSYDTWNKGLKGRQKWHNTKGLNKTAWNKGRKENREEVIKKLRKSHLGKVPWNKNKIYKHKRNSPRYLKKEKLL